MVRVMGLRLGFSVIGLGLELGLRVWVRVKFPPRIRQGLFTVNHYIDGAKLGDFLYYN